MASRAAGRRLRVLVISWHYPTPAAPQKGLWVERMCDAAAEVADVRVIVPTPWVPPGVPIEALSRFRRVPRFERRGGVELFFPRIPGSIEYFTHDYDARLALPPVLATARRLHRETPFDLIHAHFIYPDGVVAARVGQELGIPVMTSEHAFWTPWLNDRSKVANQVTRALPHIALVTGVSDFLRSAIEEYVGGAVATAVLPNVVDDRIFTTSSVGRDEHELLYVGLIRRVKRVDVLLRALAMVREEMPTLRLRILSASAFRTYAKDRSEMLALISELGLGPVVTIENGVDPAGVAAAMQRCAFVAISSARRETFCSVAAEAMACGAPQIVTRCGGPEEFVTDEDGVMVDADDPAKFAEGIRRAYARRDQFDDVAIRARVVSRFGRGAWIERAMTLYERLAAGTHTTAE